MNLEEQPKKDTEKDKPASGSEHELVGLWCHRIKQAKKYYEKDFTRMKENREFAAGLQRPEQEGLESSKIVINFLNHVVNQKVSTLYAKDPKAIYRRRKRLDYQIWDESVEKMQAAHAIVAAAQQNPQLQQSSSVANAQALLTDISTGQAWHALCDRVGKTLEILYEYQCDTQAPGFKFQMKQLVRRVVTNGVGYVRLNFSRENDAALTATGTNDSISMRLKRARQIMSDMDDDKIQENDAKVEQLEQLFTSLHSSAMEGDTTNLEERLDFDFPSASAVIVDPNCSSLKGFIGARWIAEQYILPLEDVNAYFGTDISPGGKLVIYAEDRKPLETPDMNAKKDPQDKPRVCLWEVFDIITKTAFFVIDGWKEFVEKPKAIEPSMNRFWPIFAITFNDVDVEPGDKARCYPPSDIDLLKSTQKEWNTSRQELKETRNSLRRWYATMEGWLTEPDRDKIANHSTGELVSFKGAPPGGNLKDAIIPFDGGAVDPSLFATQPFQEDAAMVIGLNSQQQQAPQRHVAATPAVIQEQARQSGASSNVDDLDDLLADLAKGGGEMMLRSFQIETVKRIVGQGAAWPEQNREDFLNSIFLDSVAASSGRPNKAVDVATAQQLGPIMLQAGANPWALIQYLAKVMDANLDPADFAPIAQPQPQQAGPGKRPQASRHPGAVGQHTGGQGMPVPVQAN